MKQREFKTIRAYFYWVYANMAMAHVAVKKQHLKYEKIDYIIRTKLYNGLSNGTMHITTLYDDEKCKLDNVACCYCGSTDNLTLDHLIPRFNGGSDSGENSVYACKSCNSSKNKEDLIVWCLKKETFPPILVLRRYLKAANEYYEAHAILDLPISELQQHVGVFRIDLLPYSFPAPALLKL